MTNFKKYNHDMIIIRFTNDKDYNTIQKYLHEQGIPWGDTGNQIISYNDNCECMHLYVHLKTDGLLGVKHYLVYSTSLDTDYTLRYT